MARRARVRRTTAARRDRSVDRVRSVVAVGGGGRPIRRADAGDACRRSTRAKGEAMTTALTSLSPAQAGSDTVEACVRSWCDAGLDVVAFNHPTEIPLLREHYDMRFVPVTATAAAE